MTPKVLRPYGVLLCQYCPKICCQAQESNSQDFGNNGLTSPFQDGSYAYLIIPGSGSGTSAQAPVLVVIDTENPSKLHKTLVP